MRHLVLLVFLIAGCQSEVDTRSPDMGADAGQDAGVDAGQDAGVDAGHDAGRDLGIDLGVDAGQDAGVDLGVDSGPACECSSGPCCDGCHFRPASYVCSDTVSSSCYGASLCQNQPRYANVVHDLRYCLGWSVLCAGSVSQTNQTTDCRMPDGITWLSYGRCDPTGVAHCVDGPDCASTYP